MLQNIDTTIKELAERREHVQNGALFIPRAYETIVKYASEVVRDLKETGWRSQFNGGLNAGYILCLMGETAKGVNFLDKSLQIHQSNMGEYDDARSSVLEFIVETLEEFGANQCVIPRYKSQLEQAQEQETDKPKDIIRKIIHIEADMECATGDLSEAYSHGRREQGLLYQRLGEHKKAIEHFQKSVEEDKMDWEKKTTIENGLSIVDSYIASGDTSYAADKFMALMKTLVPDELKLGDEIPRLLTDNFSKFYPYFKRLSIEDSLETLVRYVKARLEKIGPKDIDDGIETCRLSKILASYHVGKGEYQQASDVFDAGRKRKHLLSKREQAEFAIRAGNLEKASQLVKEDETEKESFGEDDNKTFELVNLYLQLGNIRAALAGLDGYCEHYKASLVSGSYRSVFDTRRTQIAILKAVIGKDYVQKTREYAQRRYDSCLKLIEAG